MDRDRILLTPGPLTTTLRTKLAAIAILNLDEAGETGAAAACALMIGAANTVATLGFMLLARSVNRRTQAWRRV